MVVPILFIYLWILLLWFCANVERKQEEKEDEPEKSSGSGLTEEERLNTPTILDDGKPKRSETSERRAEDVLMAEEEIEFERDIQGDSRMKTMDCSRGSNTR